METNLIERDIDIFLNKYTRFLSKQIYINKKTYNNFFNNYNYLFKELDKNIFLYKNTNRYKKIKNIEKNQLKLLKHHNQKYLNQHLLKNNDYFDKFYSKELLDKQKRKIILTEEDSLLVINAKNNIPLICGKIDYLIKTSSLKESNILVLTDNQTISTQIKNDLTKIFNYQNISIYTIIDYGKIIIDKNYNPISEKRKITILSNYIKNIFKNKELFNKLYNSFKNKIYLNKDYKVYKNFKDYHNYLYKKMYLKSKLSQNNFNKQEILKRRTYLRTINNEIVNYKEEVDIANFLYLNSINYRYNKKESIFYIYNIDNYNYIKYIPNYKSNEQPINNRYIYLYSNYLKTLKDKLKCEKYQIKLISDEELYNKLRDTTENNYFLTLINDYLIPLISHYKINNNFKNLNINKNQEQQVLNIISYYQKYLSLNKLYDQEDLINIISNNITTKKNNYKYLINITKHLNLSQKINNLTIIDNYKDNNIILKDNIKLFYDYKKYLNNNSQIPIINTYLNYQELNNLTNNYIEENIKIIESTIKSKLNKKINIYIYNDYNRLLINKNKSIITNSIISKIKTKDNLLILGNKPKDINTILSEEYFSKKNNNNIINNKYKTLLDYKSLSNQISNNYNSIILINLIPNKFDDNIFNINLNHQIKLLLYLALTKSKNKIYILWPKSKLNKISRLNLKNISIYE